ncbi:leucine-rich repeat domain-containing protein [Treponema socranskii]
MSFEKLPDDEASYMVKHYQEKAEGGYPAEPTKTESLSGKVGESAAYTTKTYEGFTYNSAHTQISGTISADGSTVIKLFYERNTVNVTFNLADGSVSGDAGPIVRTGKYGTAFTAPAPDPVKTDAVFKGWNPALPSTLLFPAADAEYTAQWTPLYTINFDVDGANGTLKAKVDGAEISPGNKVEQGKTVTFTAVPEPGCKVKEWKVDGAVVTGNTTDTYTQTVTKAVTVTVSFEVGSAVLTLSSGTTTVKVMAITFDNNPITVEGCNETSFPSNTQLELHVKSGVTTVVLKGKIVNLNCSRNNLTALNVQGLSALEKLNCSRNNLTALDVQGLSALKELRCWANQLTALNVQGLSNLQTLNCDTNGLTALDVQGLSKLQDLNCGENQLTSLNVQGLSNLQTLSCNQNKLTDLNVQGLSKLQELSCNVNGLTDLNVQGLSNLKVLSCVFNQLNAAAFTKLFNDLPQHTESDGATCTLYFEGVYHGESDGNHKDFTSPSTLQTAFQNAKNVKKWKMCKLLLESGKPKPVELN